MRQRATSTRASFLLAVSVLACVLITPDAGAFCGFYVSGADGKLFNNATMVVMMREGKRTVLSMQNNYEGPPENFAMVVPVPVVLSEENVKTLPASVFDRVDKLAAPRLVEYWEQDPCRKGRGYGGGRDRARAPQAAASPAKKFKEEGGVVVEAEFSVGEYDIVILSASDSTGLDTWLKTEGYKIPDGAEPLLRPYVEEGSKFFVAKVDLAKVKKVDGRTKLSPLRFHYDTDSFRLPIRLGLMNAKGDQDLIVHILARNQRYEVANYENVTIPTNINVDKKTKNNFGEFYAALFDATMAANKNAVVTEYSWDSSTCDPCPVPGLRGNELATLGLDVLDDGPKEEPTDGTAKPDASSKPDAVPKLTPPAPCPKGDPLCDPGLKRKIRRPRRPRRRSGFVLTRLHARYNKDSLGEDLVFRKADPIVGGREQRKDGKLEKGSQKGRVNNFQGRYAMRHKWTGVVECDEPVHGVWGGPPKGKKPGKISSALDLAFAKRGDVKLAQLVREDIPEIGITREKKPKPAADPEPSESEASDGGCGCRVLGRHGSGHGALLAAMVAAFGLIARRRRG